MFAPINSVCLPHFRGIAVLHGVSCLLGCLPGLSNDKNQPSTTSYALSRHDCFNVLTNIDFVHSFRLERMLVFRTLGLV